MRLLWFPVFGRFVAPYRESVASTVHLAEQQNIGAWFERKPAARSRAVTNGEQRGWPTPRAIS